MSSKSANYCFTTSEKTTGLMVLSEVALGNPYRLLGAKYMEKPPKGFQSTLGQGKTEPNPKEWEKLEDGVLVPCGKGTVSPVVKTSTLQYNEYIVYDTSQVKMRYLLRLNFVYKGKTGTFF